jgi:hypothetical protein
LFPAPGSSELPASAASAASGALASPLVGSGVSPAAASGAAAAAAMPLLVSGVMPPTELKKRQICFFWVQGGKAGRLHVAQTVLDHPPLLLNLPAEVSQPKVMDLMGEFLSHFILLLVHC